MRTRKELENPYKLTGKSAMGERWQNAFEEKVLEILLDIRDLLIKEKE